MKLMPSMKMIDRERVTAGVNPFRDFWDYVRADRPHRWPALGLAIAVPLVIIYFIARSVDGIDEPKRTIIYVQSWRADRSDFDVRRDWLLRARAENDANEKRRNAYGAVATAIGQGYDKNAAADEFAQARAQIDKALADLDYARANGLPLPDLPRSPDTAATAAAATPAPSAATAPPAPAAKR